MKYLILPLVIASLSLTSCTRNKAELGSEKNPIKLNFVPSVDTKVVETNAAVLEAQLEKLTGYNFSVSIPQSYVAVVEALGTKRADVAALNTFGYVMAHKKYGAQAKLTVVRHGSSTYQSQFIVKAGGKIKNLRDLNGKKMAFVDPASASGYLLPLKKMKDLGIVPGETVMAGKHDNVVSMVYNNQVDAGATFYSPPEPEPEGIQDARRLVRTQYPDIEKKVIILDLSDPIPNDAIVVRADLTEEMKTKIVNAFIKIIDDPEGKAAFKAIYGVDAVKVATDDDYAPVREMLTALGKDAAELMKK